MADFSWVNQGIDHINALSGGNQLISGAIVAWLLTSGTLVLRRLPAKLYKEFVRQFTTSITVDSTQYGFLDILSEISSKVRNPRTLKVNRAHLNVSTANLTVGYGTHFIRASKFSWWRVHISKEEQSLTGDIKTFVHISKFGRSNKAFSDLVKAAEEKSTATDKNNVKVSYWRDYWAFCGLIPKRPLSSVSLPKEDREKLLEAIGRFKSNKGWYAQHFIPHRLGIMLHGEPGTGKTSIIKAIAAELDMKLYFLPAKDLLDLDSAMDTLPANSILVIEDVDGSASVKDRGKVKGKGKAKEEHDEEFSISSSLPFVLNCLDGITSKEGVVTIFTTNHVEQLDPALLRPGRIDVSLYVTYMTIETIREYLGRFYNVTKVDWDFVPKKVTGAILQSYVLQELSLKEILVEITDSSK